MHICAYMQAVNVLRKMLSYGEYVLVDEGQIACKNKIILSLPANLNVIDMCCTVLFMGKKLRTHNLW